MDPPILNSRYALKDIRQIVDYRAGKDENTSIRMQVAFFHLQSDLPQKETLIGELREKVDEYLSDRKWQKYPGGSHQLAGEIVYRCGWLEDSLQAEDRSQKSA